MPQLDKFMEKMAELSIERTILSSNQPTRFIVAGHESTGPLITSEKLLEIVKEVAPTRVINQLENDGGIQFPYQSPSGFFNILVERADKNLQVNITPITRQSRTAAPRTRPQASMPPNVPLNSPVSTAPPPPLKALGTHKKPNYTAIIGTGVVATLFILMGGIFNNIRQAEQKKLAKVKQEQALQQQDYYNSYIAEIDDLPKKAYKIDNTGKFQFASADFSVYQIAVSNMEKRIKTDNALEGTDTTGQKSQLLAILKNQSLHPNINDTVENINTKTERELSNYIQAYGVNAMADPEVQNAVIRTKGLEGLKRLMACNNLTIGQTARELFGDQGSVSNR